MDLAVISVDELKKEIIKRYFGATVAKDEFGRRMLVIRVNSHYGALGHVFFSVEGSPPRGAAVYNPHHHTIHIIDCGGRNRIINHVAVEGHHSGSRQPPKPLVQFWPAPYLGDGYCHAERLEPFPEEEVVEVKE